MLRAHAGAAPQVLAALFGLVSLGCLAAPADAAFPGRDGRIVWVEGQFLPGGQFASGNLFYVSQRRAAGKPAEREGHMQCVESLDANSREVCPFIRPSLSPDGLTIVVGVTRALTDRYKSPRRANLALGDPNSRGVSGEALPDLTEADREPAWSPDGRQLVFVGRVEGISDLFVVERDGSNLRRLTADTHDEGGPVWSTRGEVAFERCGGVWSVRADGTGLRRLVRRGYRPDWSPDGERLLFERDRRLLTVSRTGRRLRRLAVSGTFPAWAPSGRRIAFRHKYDIYTANPDGTRRKRIHDWELPSGSSPARRYAPRDIDWGPRQR